MEMRCAERPGIGMMLWVHEFYMVIEADPGRPSGVPVPYLCQALEFKLGTNLDPEEVEGWGKKKNEVWVCGVAYAPAFHVRKFNKEKMREGYLFHTEWNDGDADTALFANCPEVVRVDNSVAWRPMSVVMETNNTNTKEPALPLEGAPYRTRTLLYGQRAYRVAVAAFVHKNPKFPRWLLKT